MYTNNFNDLRSPLDTYSTSILWAEKAASFVDECHKVLITVARPTAQALQCGLVILKRTLPKTYINRRARRTIIDFRVFAVTRDRLRGAVINRI